MGSDDGESLISVINEIAHYEIPRSQEFKTCASHCA